MSSPNINRVSLTGNLTRDPELRALPSGSSVCSLRVACNTRRRNSATDEWEDRAHFFDVTVWGAQGENCAQFLTKGRPVAIDGRLEWREWETDDGHRRQAVGIVAEVVQFLGAPAHRLDAEADEAGEDGEADDQGEAKELREALVSGGAET
jgi:single-strand DNA-binding protein